MNLIDNIRQPILDDLDVFKKFFAEALKTDNPLLTDVNKYIVQESVNKLRPMLTILSARMCGNLNNSTYFAALAMELLHNASLIHEDVVVDSIDNHLQNSLLNKVAVLSGDYMLSNSLIGGTKTENLDILKSIAWIGMELSDGELLQLTNRQNAEMTELDYFNLIRKKTAFLFAICAKVGAISANVNQEKISSLFRFGELLGICFHLNEDFVAFNKQDKSASNTSNYILNGRFSLIPKLGVVYIEQKIAELKAQAIAELAVFDNNVYKTALVRCIDFAIAR